MEEVWRRQIGNYLLIEYKKISQEVSCKIVYIPDDDLQFSFGSWGIEPEKITAEMLTTCCQGAIDYGCNVAISSFYSNYRFFQEN